MCLSDFQVLFDVARKWYELYEEMLQGTSNNGSQPRVSNMQAGPQQQLVPIQAVAAIAATENNAAAAVLQLVPCQPVTAAPQQPIGPLGMPSGVSYNMPPPGNGSHVQLPHHPYVSPYSYVQQMSQNLGHHYSQPHVTLHTHSMHPSYMATYPYQNQTAFTNMPHIQTLQQNTATLYHANILRPPPSPEGAMQPGIRMQANGQQVRQNAQPVPMQQVSPRMESQYLWGVPLWCVPLWCVPLWSVPLWGVPLWSVPLWGVPLCSRVLIKQLSIRQFPIIVHL